MLGSWKYHITLYRRCVATIRCPFCSLCCVRQHVEIIRHERCWHHQVFSAATRTVWRSSSPKGSYTYARSDSFHLYLHKARTRLVILMVMMMWSLKPHWHALSVHTSPECRDWQLYQKHANTAELYTNCDRFTTHTYTAFEWCDS